MREIKFDLKEFLKRKDFLIGAAFVIICVVGLNRILNYEKSLISTLKNQVQEESDKNVLYSQIDILDKKLDNYAAYKNIPVADLTTIINEISALAVKNDLKIDSINIEKEEEKPFFNLIPIKMTLLGKFHNFGKFSSEIESSQRFFLKVVDAKIINFKEKTSRPIPKIEMVVKIVVVKD